VAWPARICSAYRPATALDRARWFLADVDVEVVPGAGHSLPVDQAELVGRRLGKFLEQADAVP
jgi:pimeloyl-ACP methyl ester carboxylesterase